MLDLLVRGGKVVSPEMTLEQDVGIRDGMIVSISAPGAGPQEAKRIVEGAGKYVIPGGIDAHVHFGIQFPDFKVQSPFDASRAAACGGTTTIMDFAWQQHPKNGLMEAIETKRA